MKKRTVLLRKIFISVTIVSALFLSGCGNKDKNNADTPDSVAEPIEQTAPETGSTENVVTDDENPPAEGMVRSRLTNEWVDEALADKRPIAVMTPNEISAVPHYGLSQADVLYECNVEGDMTRLMGIYEDWENLEKIGNVRSARDYYIYWSFEWDSILCHYGGPFYIDEVISRDTTDNINGTVAASGVYFRSSDRSAPHNAYISAEGINQAIEQYGYSKEYRGMTDENHFQFTNASHPNTLADYEDAVNASFIDMSECYPMTKCYFKYNEEDGNYYRYQQLAGGEDGPHVDASNNEQLKFKNVIVQNTYYETRDEKGYLAFKCIDNTRDGWFFTQGKGIHVNWVKESDYGATRYYDDNGNEIILNTGKTMILIVEEGDNFRYE